MTTCTFVKGKKNIHQSPRFLHYYLVFNWQCSVHSSWRRNTLVNWKKQLVVTVV